MNTATGSPRSNPSEPPLDNNRSIVVVDRVDQCLPGYRVCRGQRVQVLAFGRVAAVRDGVQLVESRPWLQVVQLWS